jgi:hypothetical protein
VHLSPGFEELPKQINAIGPEHAFHYHYAMVQQIRIGDLKFAAHAAEA